MIFKDTNTIKEFKKDGYFALFTHSGYNEDLEQLTVWLDYESAVRMKESWFEKDRYTFILASTSDWKQ